MTEEIIIRRDSVVKEGYLEKQSQWIGAWRRRHFVLTDKYLCSFTDEGEYQNPTEAIRLHECTTVKSADEETGKDHAFRIDTLNREFYLVANSPTDKESWMSHISRQMLRPDVLTKAVEAVLASGSADGVQVTFSNIENLDDLVGSTSTQQSASGAGKGGADSAAQLEKEEQNLKARIEDLKKRKQQAVETEEFEVAAQLKKELQIVEAQLKKLTLSKPSDATPVADQPTPDEPVQGDVSRDEPPQGDESAAAGPSATTDQSGDAAAPMMESSSFHENPKGD